MSDDLPEPDRVEGAPHPRETARLIGQEAAEQAFLAARASGRMHSGWMLTGPEGVGKATLAYRIAAHLLSEPAEDGLFGAPAPPESLATDPDSHDARLVRTGAHPRLKVVRRSANEKGDRLSNEIRAADVRALKDFFHLSAPDGGRRVVIVDAADEMNVTAANSLLKELEEPPPRTTILLVAHQPSALLPTIRSRCRELRLKPLDSAGLAEALRQAGLDTEAPEALTVLSGGSVGRAVRLSRMDGLRAYAELVDLLSGLPAFDRPRALRLAEATGGRGAETRLDLTLSLIDLFLSRAAHAGVTGEPAQQGAPGEARLLARLSPGADAARTWADLSQELGARARHGRAVNLDPPAMILDILFRIEAAARRTAA